MQHDKFDNDNTNSKCSYLMSGTIQRRTSINVFVVGIVFILFFLLVTCCNFSFNAIYGHFVEYQLNKPVFDTARLLKGKQHESTTKADNREIGRWLFERLTSTSKKSCTVPPVAVFPPLPGKKGVAMTLRDEGQVGSWVENLPKVVLLNPYWNYSWSPKRVRNQPKNIEFVPMLWGGSNEEAMKTAISQYILPQIKGGTAKRLLAFNEPDHIDQSNMDVSVALSRWNHIESLKLPLVSPSCAHPEREWMKSFMSEAAKTCKRVDWVGVHWYGSNYEIFKSEMRKYYNLYKRPILITEFALADWSATTVSDNKISKSATMKFMKQALPWLEKQPWIVGYAWFSFKVTDAVGTNSALFNENGTITALGRYYASVRTDRILGDQSIRPDK